MSYDIDAAVEELGRFLGWNRHSIDEDRAPLTEMFRRAYEAGIAQGSCLCPKCVDTGCEPVPEKGPAK